MNHADVAGGVFPGPVRTSPLSLAAIRTVIRSPVEIRPPIRAHRAHRAHRIKRLFVLLLDALDERTGEERSSRPTRGLFD
jgi:hypothetical protein